MYTKSCQNAWTKSEQVQEPRTSTVGPALGLGVGMGPSNPPVLHLELSRAFGHDLLQLEFFTLLLVGGPSLLFFLGGAA